MEGRREGPDGGPRTRRVLDADYPARLRELSSPPDPLFLTGRWDHPGPHVAIVGSRSATEDGLDVARELAAALSARGVAIVSGLARGIDAAAHEGALGAGGLTGAVLGTSLDEIYPPEHAGLHQSIARSLGLMSEIPPGAHASRNTFAARNRMVAAMADVVVVVQGAAGSGAMITAQEAARMGRPVAALPWDSRDPLGEAPHELIRSGRATLVRNAADVLELIGIGDTAPRRVAPTHSLPLHLAPHEDALLRALRERPLPLDQLAASAQLTASEVSVALIGLELRNLARRLPGGVAQRTARARRERSTAI
ncbi:MAG TPA: DNA-processing protein DprA [Candidatus Dormibacteraeota bacterium]|nr:DNA-processing protein DprA [Candidatus Dormibacteraeota bacterium]